MQSNWNYDVNKEQEVGKFLDSYLYSKEYIKNFVRITSFEQQKKGMDVTFSYDNENMIVDEKAQTDYVNKDLPTFAFEIDGIGSGIIKGGWLFDETKLTTHYMLIWIWAKDSNITYKDITKLHCLLISRKKIIEFLKNRGLTKDYIYKKAKEIRKTNIHGSHIIEGDDLCKFFLSINNKQEGPLNIVIRKSALLELSNNEFEVKPQ